MNKFICLLRGINVSGKNIIKMDSLKQAFIDLDFDNVKTYIQSGNIIFTSKLSNECDLEILINKKISQEFNLNIPVLVITENTLKEVIQENCYIKDASLETSKLHVTFISQKPKSTDIATLNLLDFGNDQFKITQNVIYLYCINGYGNTKLTNTFFEKKLKVNCTTRNWNTTVKLGEMVRELS